MPSGKENMGSKFVTFDQQSRQLNLGKHCVGAKSQVSPNWEIPQRLEKLLQDFTSLKLLSNATLLQNFIIALLQQ